MSGRILSVRLRTLCGCTQFRVLDGPAPEFIEVPIAALNSDADDRVLQHRRFRLTRLDPPDVGAAADYEEVP